MEANLNKESLHIRLKQLIRTLISDTQPEYLISERELQRQFLVSRTTIRKTLNELVQEKRLVAEQGRGYRVLYGAQGGELAGKIGFALLNTDDVFVNAVFRTMIDEIFSKKFEPVVTIIDPRYESPAEKLAKLLASTDALFINSGILQKRDSLLERELFRCLALPYAVKDMPVCSVMADMKKGARLLTSYLLRNGHREIATLFADSERGRGFEQIMNRYGVKINRSLQCECRGYRHAAYKAMGNLLAGKRDFSAVICQNDLAALGAMEQCFRQGIKVPEDISIVGFDNIQDSELFPVPLTTAGIDLKTMCKKALSLLLEGLRTGKSQAAVKLKPELIIRKSVRL